MSDSNEKNLPWQYFPEKFIRFASRFKDTNDEFERLIGYLLLDVGVETLFKVYILMTNSDASLKYPKREAIAKGTIGKDKIPDSGITAADFDTANFHILVETIKRLSDSKVSDENVKRAEYFHKLRNNIYHQGVKSSPPKKDFDEYLALAQSFLKTLLGVDVDKPAMVDQQAMSELTLEERLRYIAREVELSMALYDMQKIFQNLQLNIAVAVEVFAPKYASKRFEKGLKKIKESFPDNEDGSVSERYENQSSRIRSFKELMGKEIEEEIDFIDKVLNDITYLYLDILLSLNVVDDNDIANYREYRYFVERFHDRPDDASREDREKILQLQDWAEKIEGKLDTLDPKHKSDS